MEDKKLIEKISKMSLLEMNYESRNQTFSADEIASAVNYVRYKLIDNDLKNVEGQKEKLKLIEKVSVMYKFTKTTTVTVTDFFLIQCYYPIFVAYYNYFTDASFNELLGNFGDIVKDLEKRTEKLSKNMFKFFDLYVFVLTVAILGIIGSILIPNILGFFPTVLGGMIVFLFLFLLFRGRFIGAFLVPGAIIFLADFIEKYIPEESMFKVGLLVFIASLVVLVIRLVYKKLVKPNPFMTPKRFEFGKLSQELTYYIENVESIIDMFSFTCDEMVNTYIEHGKTKEIIEQSVAYVNKYIGNPDDAENYQIMMNSVSTYYKHILKRLNEIEAKNDELLEDLFGL